MTVDQNTFFSIQSKFDNVPFNQTKEWMLSNYNKQLQQVVYFVDDLNSPNICCWGVVFNRKFIGKHLIIDGESFNKEISSKQIKHFYEKIIASGFSLIDISNISFYDSNYEIGVRRAGFIRPLGLTLSSLTLLVNLVEPFKFHRNWRRNVKKATDECVFFRSIQNPSKEDARTFVALFSELKERKKLGYILDVDNVIKLLNSENYKLFFACNNLETAIAGRIVYVHKNKSYDLYAANTDAALSCGAVYYLQEQILLFLKSNNIDSFDYGRIPPSNDDMDAIYIAKSYSNGNPVSYNGQWQFSKSKLLVFIVSLKIFYFNRTKRY